MKKKAFITPTVIFLLMLYSLAIGAMMASVTAFVGIMDMRVSFREHIEASELGIKLAEDWLLSSIASGNRPRLSQSATGNFAERVEAIRPDGGRAGYEHGWDGFDIDLYVADTNYASRLPGTSDLTIPRIPELFTSGGFRRCYFLRCTATSKKIPETKLVNEELLAVSFDQYDKMLGVSRLFYRSTSTVK
jgi:hypothetical protein